VIEGVIPLAEEAAIGYGYPMTESSDLKTLTRDVEAAIIPVGDKVTLQKGEQATLTQSLGGSYTVIVNGNMFRIEGKDADALGMEVAAKSASTGTPITQENLEKGNLESVAFVLRPRDPGEHRGPGPDLRLPSHSVEWKQL